MNVRIGLTPESLTDLSTHLTQVLADEFVLALKTRNAHWNVEGSDFYNSHKFFEEQFEILDQLIDEIAERIRSLGHYAPATLKEFLNLTHLTEQTREANTKIDYIKTLLTDHETLIINVREKLKLLSTNFVDAGTADFLTALMEKHEKIAWILRAHLN